MDFFTELKESSFISTTEAIQLLLRMTGHYQGILENILKIKQNHSEEGEGFRRRSANTELLNQLSDVLNQLERGALHVEQVRLRQQATPDQCNKQVLKILKQAMEACEAAYGNHARSFAMILQDLERLYSLFQEKLGVPNHDKKTKASAPKKAELKPAEQLVYVRVFHKDMEKLGTPQSLLSWAKPLLESIQFSEKHGLAIFDDEETVKKSLKNNCYGYVTVRIEESQNVSKDNPGKMDQALGVPLLTINNIRLDQMVKLTHKGVEYPIREGRLQPPKSP